MDKVELILYNLTMHDVLEKYGFEADGKGYINCPFHSEKTASCRLYEKSFYCFGCGVGGDLINFVSKLFELDFTETLKRIDTDFTLGLFKKPTLSQHRRNKKALKQLQKNRDESERQKTYNRYAYKQLISYYWWLKERPDSKNKTHDINFIERLLDKFLKLDTVIPFDIDALINALKSKFESEV